jgi:predicted PurR-regulated permease PerM
MNQPKDSEQESKQSGRLDLPRSAEKSDDSTSTMKTLPTVLSQQSLIARLVLGVLLLVIVGAITVFFLLKQPGDLRSQLKTSQAEVVNLKDKYQQITFLESEINRRWENIDKEMLEIKKIRSQLRSLVNTK